MIKNIEYKDKARTGLKNGVEKLSKAVGATLGPGGRNVIIETDGLPVITKDGVSVAKRINLKDPIENLGAQMMKEVSIKTNEEAGDGTTTATVLAHRILTEGYKEIEQKNINPVQLKRSIDKELEDIKSYLNLLCQDIKVDSNKLKHIINISSNGDEEVTELIHDILVKTNNSEILLEQSLSRDSYTEYIEGMSFKSSYIDTFFTNDSLKSECNFKDSCILLVDGKLKSSLKFAPALDKIAQLDKPLVLIAEEINQDIFMTLAANKNNGTLQSVVLNAPGFGPGRKEILNDLAIYTGAEIVRNIESFEIEQLGHMDSIRVDENKSCIMGGKGNKEEIDNRILDLEKSLDKIDDYTKDIIKQRISKFKGGIGVIHIGANTELEFKEKYDRVEDAINAAKAALEEGIIAGGGTTLKYISEDLKERSRIGVLQRSLVAPYEKIAENLSNGYKMNTKQAKEKNIYDPKKVTRTALENAVSVVGTILTTECVITNG